MSAWLLVPLLLCSLLCEVAENVGAHKNVQYLLGSRIDVGTAKQLKDANAVVGKLFEYVIPAAWCSGSRLPQVTEGGSNGYLPSWLHYSNHTLQGVPTAVDSGAVYLQVSCPLLENSSKNGAESIPEVVTSDVFVVNVGFTDSVLQRIKSRSASSSVMKDLDCLPYEAVFKSNIIIDRSLHKMMALERIGTIRKMASFLSLDADSISLLPAINNNLGRLIKTSVLAAGPGNLKTLSTNEGVALSWTVACGTLDRTHELETILERNVKSGRVSSHINHDILGWRITKDDARTHKPRRLRRQAIGTPVPTPVPSTMPTLVTDMSSFTITETSFVVATTSSEQSSEFPVLSSSSSSASSTPTSSSASSSSSRTIDSSVSLSSSAMFSKASLQTSEATTNSTVQSSSTSVVAELSSPAPTDTTSSFSSLISSSPIAITDSPISSLASSLSPSSSIMSSVSSSQSVTHSSQSTEVSTSFQETVQPSSSFSSASSAMELNTSMSTDDLSSGFTSHTSTILTSSSDVVVFPSSTAEITTTEQSTSTEPQTTTTEPQTTPTEPQTTTTEPQTTTTESKTTTTELKTTTTEPQTTTSEPQTTTTEPLTTTTEPQTTTTEPLTTTTEPQTTTTEPQTTTTEPLTTTTEPQTTTTEPQTTTTQPHTTTTEPQTTSTEPQTTTTQPKTTTTEPQTTTTEPQTTTTEPQTTTTEPQTTTTEPLTTTTERQTTTTEPLTTTTEPQTTTTRPQTTTTEPQITTTQSQATTTKLLTTTTEPETTTTEPQTTTTEPQTTPTEPQTTTTDPQTTSTEPQTTTTEPQTTTTEPQTTTTEPQTTSTEPQTTSTETQTTTTEPQTTSTEPQTTTTTVPPNLPPVLYNPIDVIRPFLGEPFRVSIPPDTFHDPEDGTSDKLLLELLTVSLGRIPADYWIQFNASDMAIYGLPIQSDFADSTLTFVLRATDSAGLYAVDAIQVVVQTRSLKSSHIFSIELNTDYNAFMLSRDNAINVVRGIDLHYGDGGQNFVAVSSIEAGSVIFAWSNNTLSRTVCQVDLIQSLRSKLVNLDGTVNSGLTEALRPFQVLNAQLMYQGICAVVVPPSVLTPAPVKPVVADDSDMYLVSVLPAVGLAVVMLVVAVLFFLLYKHRRSGHKYVAKDEKHAYMKSRMPTILPEEKMEMQDAVSPKKSRPRGPTILDTDLDFPTGDDKRPLYDDRPAPPRYKLPHNVGYADLFDQLDAVSLSPPPSYRSEATFKPPPMYRLPPSYLQFPSESHV